MAIGDLSEGILKRSIYQGGSTPPNISYQASHGFIVGDVIRVVDNEDGTYTFYKAKADSLENVKAIGMVSEILSTNLFRYVNDGYVSPTDTFAYIVGEYYYLSAQDEGKITDVSTLDISGIEQAVGFGTEKGFKVEIGTNEPDLRTAITSAINPELFGLGIPYYMHDEVAEIPEESDYMGASSELFYQKALTDLPDLSYAQFIQVELANNELGTASEVIQKFVTIAGEPGITAIDANAWIFETWAEVDTDKAECFLQINVYKRDLAGVETLILSVEQLIKSFVPTKFSKLGVGTAVEMEDTDRLVFEYVFLNKSTENTRTMTFWYEGDCPTNVKMPLSVEAIAEQINKTGKIKHNTLKDLQGGLPAASDSSEESSGEADGEYYHHTKDEYDTHVYEAPIDGNMYAREDGEWVEVTNEFETVTDMSVVGDGTASNPVVLAFDEELPGSNKVYGTDGGGIKGWKPDPTVDSVEFTSIEEDSSTTLPAVTNTNNIVRLIIGRTSALPDLTADLGGMAAMKCWNGSTAEYNNIDSDDIDDDTYYFLTE